MPRTQDTRGKQIIDSRDIIARFDDLNDDRENLESEIEDKKQALDEFRETMDPEKDEDDEKETELSDELKDAKQALEDWDDIEEWQALKNLIDQCEGYGDWRHGETLIRDDYFTEYAEDLASDIGDYDPRNVRWPYTCIDWEKAADELKRDYMQVEFDGTTYWTRS